MTKKPPCYTCKKGDKKGIMLLKLKIQFPNGIKKVKMLSHHI